MQLTSPEFQNDAEMPAKYTCEGEGISPPLRISSIPSRTKSMVLIVDDPDAPDPKAPKRTWDHWVVWNIPPDTLEIPEGSLPDCAIVGTNSWQKQEYGGPCPPVGKHRYFFKIYALDVTLDLPATATKRDIESSMAAHIIDKTALVGLYQKST